ncbi:MULTISPECIES: hypothetical protein [Vibrio]|uniref:Uncharacterized protein n=1 Tax=Vibrio proteolyticus NBRC 13287 TaxID=1219065 RepID=U3A7E8_VIBPR|nr:MULTISPECIES: hypothetical protein [Vibrio]NAX22646.1 hypothetical protein [Vibrio sp. V39_P1S14PM300]GAD69262.1 hypothetical protein VPR01S_26_00250 [Vibrio proteolyticus NBRC 13287]
MFKNKHFIIALLIAPILSIIAYFGTDMAVSEKAQPAQEGATYKLASKSNCRYTSGLCDMENGDFKVQFRSEHLGKQQLDLSLKADYPLEGVKVSLVNHPDQTAAPVDMLRSDDSAQHWTITLPAPSSDTSRLRVAISANGTTYFGETETDFVVYQTLLDDKQRN